MYTVPLIDLHIGVEKTGTTAVQHYLRHNEASLLQVHGVLFPRCLGHHRSASLAAACQLRDEPDDLRRLRGLLNPAQVATYYRQLVREFDAELSRCRPRRVVISSEHLSSRLRSRAELLQLRSFLQPFCSRLRVVVYLRRQDQLFLSAYSTAVKSGRTRPFRYPDEGAGRKDLHYDRLLGRWAQVFGEANLCVRLYEQQRLGERGVVGDLCRALDLPADLQQLQEQHNVSFNATMLDCLRELNRHLPRFVDGQPNPLRGDIIAALAGLDLPGEPFRGNGDNRRYYRRYEDGNREVAQRWFATDESVPTELFAGTVEDVEPSPDMVLQPEKLLELCAGVWQFAQRQLQLAQSQQRALEGELRQLREQLQAIQRHSESARDG